MELRLTGCLSALMLTTIGVAQSPILLNGQIWDGNGGPLLSGSVYHVVGGPGNCGIQVPPNQTLTVQPGAVIKVDGCVTISGHLHAVGTPLQKIEITSIHDDAAGGDTNGNGGATVPQAGDWSTIELFGTMQLEHCRVRYGGGNNNAAFSLRNQVATLRDCLVDRALAAGIRDALNATIEDCHFEDLGGIAVDGIDFKRLDQFNDNTAVNCAGGEYARITDAVQLTVDVTMAARHSINGSGVFVMDIGSPRSPRVMPGATLTMPAGTVLKVKNPSGLLTSAGGRIDAQGTAANPVVITSIHDDDYGGDTENDGNATSPARGDWWQVQLQQGDDSSFQNTIIRYGDSPAAVVLSGSSAQFVDCTIEQSFGDAMLFNNVATPPASLRDCRIRENGGRPVRDMAWTELEGCRGNTTSNNGGGDQFHVASGFVTARATIDPGHYPGEVLEVANRITINNGGALTFEAGVILKWTLRNFNTGINVNGGGELNLNGTARRPVVLTSIRDDAWGGDSNGDGNATQPAPGDWERLWVGGGSTMALGRAENTLIRYAGRSSNAIECGSAVFELRQVRIEHPDNDGIRLDRVGVADNLVVFDAADDGIQLSNTTFDLRHVTVAGCGGGGVHRTGGWSGTVRNSIAWNNAGGNFVGLTAADVRASNGGFAGQNGNLDVDPQFVNAASGNLGLQSGSPCLGVADLATAQLVARDMAETSRLQDHNLAGNPLPDMGAYERAVYTMTVTGEPTFGSTIDYSLQGPSGIGAVLVSVAAPGALFVPGIGIALVGLPNVPLPPTVVAMGQPVSFDVPVDPGFYGVRFHAQGVGVQLSGPLVGGFTHLERSRIRFD
ncbi:MAG: hypothetical protein NXI31_01680 [bacterium]|nr:hypothetical protein [bacterium]